MVYHMLLWGVLKDMLLFSIGHKWLLLSHLLPEIWHLFFSNLFLWVVECISPKFSQNLLLRSPHLNVYKFLWYLYMSCVLLPFTTLLILFKPQPRCALGCGLVINEAGKIMGDHYSRASLYLSEVHVSLTRSPP